MTASMAEPDVGYGKNWWPELNALEPIEIKPASIAPDLFPRDPSHPPLPPTLNGDASRPLHRLKQTSAVKVDTDHRVKGLRFEVVFFPGLGAAKFSRHQAAGHAADEQADYEAGSQSQLFEPVARARESLYGAPVTQRTRSRTRSTTSTSWRSMRNGCVVTPPVYGGPHLSDCRCGGGSGRTPTGNSHGRF